MCLVLFFAWRNSRKQEEKKKQIPASEFYSNREEIDTLNKKKNIIYSIQLVTFERNPLGNLMAPQVLVIYPYSHQKDWA